MLADVEERRSAKEKTVQQMHAAEIEETARGLAEIRMDLGLLGEVQQSLETRREEEIEDRPNAGRAAQAAGYADVTRYGPRRSAGVVGR